MNEQELEDKIWDNTGIPIHKTGIWSKVGGHKKTCFDKIDEMKERGELKDDGFDGTKMMFVRLDSIKQAEFESGLTFQVNMLKNFRETIGKMKKPLFRKIGIYKTTRWSSGLRKSIREIDKKGEYKPRTETVKTNLDNMAFYYTALLLFISRANLQLSLGLISKSVAEKRIKKCENALEYHFKKLLSDNPRDSNAIRQYYKHKIFGIDRFRID